MSSATSTSAVSGASKASLIVNIIQLALIGLQAVPQTAAPAALAETFVGILQNALGAYQAEVGQPFDATKIPIEQPVS